MCVFTEKYPIHAILRNGTIVQIRNYLEVQVLDGRHEGFQCDVTNDCVTLSSQTLGKDKNITIYGAISNGDMKGIFVDNVYGKLPVKDRTVIDIGANIADSAIYFALSGADKIIGLEPSPENFKLAEKNIKSNDLKNISIILGGCSNRKDEIRVEAESNYETGILFTLKNCKSGTKVSLLTLKDILADNKIDSRNSVILKMDCEGCEYESILSADENTLQRFSHILIEYHHGYKDLRDALQKSGFKVSVTRPKLHSRYYESVGRKLKFAVGYIYAERI